eukprot:PhF_6_TR13639/c1_g1_i1/m.21866
MISVHREDDPPQKDGERIHLFEGIAAIPHHGEENLLTGAPLQDTVVITLLAEVDHHIEEIHLEGDDTNPHPDEELLQDIEIILLPHEEETHRRDVEETHHKNVEETLHRDEETHHQSVVMTDRVEETHH